MGTSAMQDDPLLRLRYYKETGQAREAATYEAYLRSTGQLPSPEQITTATAPDQPDQAPPPSYATKVLGGLASFLKDVPGGEAAQAAVRSVVRGQSYPDALKDIQTAEAAAPSAVRNVNRIAGGTIAALAIPGTPAIQAARYGVLSGLGNSDPTQTVADRLDQAGLQGVVGGLVGKAGDMLVTGVRGKLAPALGKAAMARKAAIQAADQANYARAAAEGASAPPTAVVTAALSAPDIKPYVDVLKSSRTMAGADDATLLREAYKLMSERQGSLANRIVNANDFKAGTSLDAADVKAAKQELLNAADRVMPSFRPAVQAHATAAAERDAFRTGADAARRAISGAGVAGKKLETLSPEAALAKIKAMSPAEADAAMQGVLGRVGEGVGLSANPKTFFGIGPTLRSAGSVAPYLRALEARRGGVTSVNVLRSLIASQGGGLLSP